MKKPKFQTHPLFDCWTIDERNIFPDGVEFDEVLNIFEQLEAEYRGHINNMDTYK